MNYLIKNVGFTVGKATLLTPRAKINGNKTVTNALFIVVRSDLENFFKCFRIRHGIAVDMSYERPQEQVPDIDTGANMGTWVNDFFEGDRKDRILKIICARLASCCTNPAACAEEIFHDVLIDLKNIDIRSVDSPEAYFIRSAARLAVRSHRRNWFQNKTGMEEDAVEVLDHMVGGDGPQVEQQRAAARLILIEFKGAITAEEWTIFDLHYYQGFTDVEISRSSEAYFGKKLSRGAVRQRVRRVTDRFREFAASRNTPGDDLSGISHTLLVYN